MEQSNDCIDHILCVLSSNFRGIPFSWGFRPAVSFTAGMDPLSLRSGADHPFHCVATNRKWSAEVNYAGHSLLLSLNYFHFTLLWNPKFHDL